MIPRKVPQKIYRHGARKQRGKGEKVGPLRRINVRAHRFPSDRGGMVNPTGRKVK